MRSIWLILFVSCSWQFVAAQVDVELSSEQGIFGKPETIRVIFPISKENTSWKYDISAFAKNENIRILGDSAMVNGTAQMGYSGDQRITFVVYDTGYISIPVIPIITELGDTFNTTSFEYYIGPLQEADDRLEPIRPIIKEPLKFSDLLPYLIGITLLAMILLVIRYVWKRGGKEEVETDEPLHIESPYDEAMRTIRELRARELWAHGKDKELYVEMSYLFRRYLEKEIHIPALESPSGEIKQMLKGTSASNVLVSQGLAILERSDAVKYAKFRIAPKQCISDLDDMKAWIIAFATMLDETREEEE